MVELGVRGGERPSMICMNRIRLSDATGRDATGRDASGWVATTGTSRHGMMKDVMRGHRLT